MKIIITGAASGIGRQTARLFAAEPHGGVPSEILLVDRDEGPLGETAREIEAGGGRVGTCVADLADIDTPARIVAATVERFGGIDALISNAGAIHSFPLLQLRVEEFDRLIAVNARATLLLAQAAHPLLKAARGVIIATVSTAAENPAVPLGAYSASKAALLMLVRQIAAEWGPDGIRCNGVSPGPTHTSMTSASYDDPAVREQRGRDIPLGRVGQPADVARAIHFLAGPAASFISGVNLLVDGGLSSRLGASSSGAANAMTSR